MMKKHPLRLTVLRLAGLFFTITLLILTAANNYAAPAPAATLEVAQIEEPLSEEELRGLINAIEAQAAADAAAEAEALKDQPVLDSPHAAMLAFLTHINQAKNSGDATQAQAKQWQQTLACLDLPSELSEPTKAQQTAIELWSALNHIRKIDIDAELPKELPDSTQRYIFFPKNFSEADQEIISRLEGESFTPIALERGSNGQWRFAKDTLSSIDQTYALFAEKLSKQYGGDQGEAAFVESLMPSSLTGPERFLTLGYWQWVVLIVLVVIGVCIDFGLRGTLTLGALTVIRRFKGKAQKETIARFTRPLGWFFAGIFWLLTLRLAALPVAGHRFLFASAALFTVLVGIWVSWRLIDLGAEVLLSKAEKTENKFDDILVPMCAKAAKLVCFVMGVVYAANAMNIPLGPMLASIGVGSLAFAFAAKDTIENFFGSIAVILDRPFEVGDWVVIDGKNEGTVEEVGFRSTRIRTFYNSQITIPNSTLVRASVDNYGRRQYRRWKTTLGVQYDTTPEQLLAFTEGIRELVRNHPYTRKDYFQVWTNGFGASSIDVLLYIFHEVPDWSTELRERERMIVDIMRLADGLGVQFAYPTQTLHLYQEEHKDHQSSLENPTSMTDRRAMVSGLHAAQAVVKDQPWLEKQPAPVTYVHGRATDIDEAGNPVIGKEEN